MPDVGVAEALATESRFWEGKVVQAFCANFYDVVDCLDLVPAQDAVFDLVILRRAQEDNHAGEFAFVHPLVVGGEGFVHELLERMAAPIVHMRYRSRVGHGSSWLLMSGASLSAVARE